MEIYTLICNNEPEEKINYLITERIINPVKADLGINLFRYTEDDIMGMIFFSYWKLSFKMELNYVSISPCL